MKDHWTLRVAAVEKGALDTYSAHALKTRVIMEGAQ